MITALILSLSLHTGARERARPMHDLSPPTTCSQHPLAAPHTSPMPPRLVQGNPGVHLIAAGAHPSESGLRFRARRTLDRAR